jgi:hypothetical protein
MTNEDHEDRSRRARARALGARLWLGAVPRTSGSFRRTRAGAGAQLVRGSRHARWGSAARLRLPHNMADVYDALIARVLLGILHLGACGITRHPAKRRGESDRGGGGVFFSLLRRLVISSAEVNYTPALRGKTHRVRTHARTLRFATSWRRTHASPCPGSSIFGGPEGGVSGKRGPAGAGVGASGYLLCLSRQNALT